VSIAPVFERGWINGRASCRFRQGSETRLKRQGSNATWII